MGLEEKLKNLSARQAAIVGLVLAALYYLMMYDGGAEYEKRTRMARNKLNSMKTKVNRLNQKIQESEKIESELKEKNKELKVVMEYLPEEFSPADLMKILSTEAKSAGAQIEAIDDETRRSSRDEDKVFETIKVGVSLQGSYSQLLLFLSYLTRANKIISLDSLNMKTSRDFRRAEGGGRILTFEGDFLGYKSRTPEGEGSVRR